MEDLCKLDNLEIDFSKITPVENVCETLIRRIVGKIQNCN